MKTEKGRRWDKMTDEQRRARSDQIAARERDEEEKPPKRTPEQVRQAASILRWAYKGS